MKKKKLKKKVFMVPGDEIDFTLTEKASFEPANVFSGTVTSIHHDKFAVHVAPDEKTRQRLKSMTGENGVIETSFRCCRIKDMEHHKALVLRQAAQLLAAMFPGANGRPQENRVPKKSKAPVYVYNPEKSKAEALEVLAKKKA